LTFWTNIYAINISIVSDLRFGNSLSKTYSYFHLNKILQPPLSMQPLLRICAATH